MKNKIPCPVTESCNGAIINVKCTVTGQVLYACTECSAYFAGTQVPTFDTPCEISRWYKNMLELNDHSWKMTNEEITEQWDYKHYFTNIYPSKYDSLEPVVLESDICPACKDLVKYKAGIDQRGLPYRMDWLKQNRLRVATLSCTGQLIRHCRFCDSIWPAQLEVNWEHYGGTLGVYLALLGVVKYHPF